MRLPVSPPGHNETKEILNFQCSATGVCPPFADSAPSIAQTPILPPRVMNEHSLRTVTVECPERTVRYPVSQRCFCPAPLQGSCPWRCRLPNRMKTLCRHVGPRLLPCRRASNPLHGVRAFCPAFRWPHDCIHGMTWMQVITAGRLLPDPRAFPSPGRPWRTSKPTSFAVTNRFRDAARKSAACSSVPSPPLRLRSSSMPSSRWRSNIAPARPTFPLRMTTSAGATGSSRCAKLPRVSSGSAAARPGPGCAWRPKTAI